MKDVAILDYCSGNIASLFSAFRSINADPYLASTKDDLRKAKAIVLPGVGHFGYASENLKMGGLRECLIDLIKKGIPTLGICLGFQLLTRSSEESIDSLGLEILPLRAIHLEPENWLKYKVPHVGWNSIYHLNKSSRLLHNICPERRTFYYSNAYGVLPSLKFDSMQAIYLHEKPFIAIVEYNNIFGVQFHPEKSRSQGLQLLKNFLQN